MRSRSRHRSRVLIILFCASCALLSFGPVALSNQNVVYISTPDLCSEVSSVEGSNVFLVSKKDNCNNTEGKIPVPLEPSIKVVRIYSNGHFWKEHGVEGFDLNSLNNLFERAESTKPEVAAKKHNQKAQGLANKISNYINSDHYQKKIRDETARIKRDIFKGKIKDYHPKSSKKTSYLEPKERIYIFISSSIPITTLRNYAIDLDKLRDPRISMVMRGFVGGMKKIKPTLEFVSKIFLKDKGCKLEEQNCETYMANLTIDPLLFRRYAVERVPAVVYARDLLVADPAISEGLDTNASLSPHYIVYGDASLDYVLSVIYRETQSVSINKIHTALTRGLY